MENGLKKAMEHISEHGMPSEEAMRAAVEDQEIARLIETTKNQLAEYTNLFNRFKKGEELTDEEKDRMFELSEELERLAKSVRRAREGR